MGETDLRRRVAKVLEIILRQEISTDSDFTRKDSDAWDSLKHIEVMFALEDEFGIEFSEAELSELDSISTIVSAVAAKQ